MSSDGNAASSFSNDVSHQLYSRAGLNHKATIAVAASCSAFAFLLLICLGLCCCIGSRVRSSRTIQGGQHGSGSEDWNTSQVEVQSYNPSQLWTPTPAERDLEYAASQRHRGWAIGRNIPGLEEHPTAVEMGTEIPSRAPNGSTSAAVLHLPVRHPLRTEVWSQTSTPSDEGSMKPQAAFTQPPALKCCNNTFRTQADYKYTLRLFDLTSSTDLSLAVIDDTTISQ